MVKQIKRYLLITVGFMSITLGVIGIVVPVLPTTPFLILALACFARSSQRFHHKLLSSPYIGEILHRWEQDKCIDKPRKRQIQLLVVCSFFISILLLQSVLYLQLLLLALMAILLFFIHGIAER